MAKQVFPRLRNPASGRGGEFTQPMTTFFGQLCTVPLTICPDICWAFVKGANFLYLQSQGIINNSHFDSTDNNLVTQETKFLSLPLIFP